MTSPRFLLSLAAAVLAASGLLATASAASASSGTTYYVNVSTGNDSNSGTSPSSAWQSLAKVDAQTFQPGDRILFKAGESWTGQLALHGSGAAGSPIIVSSYGTGAKPAINGDGTTGAAVLLSNEHDITINGLQITNTSNSGIYRDGIEIYAKDAGPLPGITIENNYVHDIDGPTGSSVDIGYGGIIAEVRGNTTPTYFTGMRITGNEVADVPSYGIVTWSTWMSRDGWSNLWAETGVPSSEIGPYTPSTGLVISDNYVHDIGNGGISPNMVENTLIDHNTVTRTAMQYRNVAIWWSDANNTTVEYNDVSDTHYNGYHQDSTAFDADEATYGSIVQYNFTHDNGDGFFMTCSANNAAVSDAVVRYNISQDDSGSLFMFICSNAQSVNIYNNTIYTSASTGLTLHDMVYATGNNTGIDFRNNIFYNPVGLPYGTSGTTYSGNAYFGGSPPPDSKAIIGDPLLSSPGRATGMTDLRGYTPASNSPMLAAGAVISGNGGHDILGNALPATAPDLGAVQASTRRPAPVTVVTSSYPTGQGKLSNIVNGDPQDSWASVSSGITFPGTITINYGVRRTISAVTIQTWYGQGQGITDLGLQTWNGSAWVTRVAGAALTWDSDTSTVESRTIAFPAPVTTTQLRLVIHNANLEWGDLSVNQVSTTS
jgi:hypothetical protein